jgi:hypothetical protein
MEAVHGSSAQRLAQCLRQLSLCVLQACCSDQALRGGCYSTLMQADAQNVGCLAAVSHRCSIEGVNSTHFPR